MKRVIATFVIAVAALVGLSATAQAQSVTLCHDVTVVVNGEAVVDDAGCQTVPAEE